MTAAEVESWGELRRERPHLAAAGHRLLYQYGVGLAFLATVRPDGGPRVHPVCPIATDDGLYAFVIPSPKREDLHRDGRFALHSFPTEDDEDAFYLAGTARQETDVRVRNGLEQRFHAERTGQRPIDLGRQELFEFMLDVCVLTVTSGHGDPAPHHTVWRRSRRNGNVIP